MIFVIEIKKLVKKSELLFFKEKLSIQLNQDVEMKVKTNWQKDFPRGTYSGEKNLKK